jgi:hypothetical protein
MVFYCPTSNSVVQPIGKPPRCFVRELGDLIAHRVILQDPNHNELEVRVVKKYKKVYFDDGWCDLRDIYCIPFGAWVVLTYIEPKLLLIRLINRFGREIEYPQHNPPLRRLLTDPGSSTIPLPNIRVRPLTFVRTYVKKMTYDDIHSGTLVLFLFCLQLLILIIFVCYCCTYNYHLPLKQTLP